MPKLVEIRETLPMSAVGKILYRILRDEHGSATSAPLPDPAGSATHTS